MIKYLFLLVLISCISCQTNKSLVRDNISIKLYPYQDKNEMRAAALPELKPESELMKFSRRFEYLLMNIPEIHLPEKATERNEIGMLYPDTNEISRVYMNKYTQDKKLVKYFEESYTPIKNPDFNKKKTFTTDELMEVASKFFYCDKVGSDTSVQSHVCIGINGLAETRWKKDYTLLAAFCFEAIFDDFDKDISQISESYGSEKEKACQKYRSNITSLNQYLEDVKLELFERMKNDGILTKKLLEYYETNKTNLAFKIEN